VVRTSLVAFENILVPTDELNSFEYTWSLTLSEEHRLRVSENEVQRRIFGPKGEEVVGGWRRLHNEALNNCLLRQILLG
jgi:hypothetical protein